MFRLKPDYEATRRRMDAFWACDLLDRPLVQFYLAKPPAEQTTLPVSGHTDAAARWLDTEFMVETALASLNNQEFLGDTLPIAYPNLGPEIFSAMYGCPLHFGDYGTSWTDPILHDWAQAGQVQFDWQNPWLKKLDEMTAALIDAGAGLFITGMTDWHPGGDCLAAFRDPQALAEDMITHPAEVQQLLQRVTADYFQVYEHYYAMLRAAGLPITSWTPLIYDGRYYIPSNDFSIMVSQKMYTEFFLPGIAEECRFLDRSIYHLDGPGALRHLDVILSIPELNALQWVPGAGNEDFSRWVEVYRRVQAAGKGIQVNCHASELPEVIETLNPRGLYLNLSGVTDRPMAENILSMLEKWALRHAHDRIAA